ncbi:FAD-dependent thymidylate synthase, partial [Candidatus Fermentibacterales bacterium]|nr:FAD-dependent thymidylate synthase [Candidatus Fermentibacterales bacterium]
RETFGALRAEAGPCADYSLLNATRRAVVLAMNARELYHFSRLREDEHAQWDIRAIARKMLELARESAPLTMSLSGGKSEIAIPE